MGFVAILTEFRTGVAGHRPALVLGNLTSRFSLLTPLKHEIAIPL